VPIAILASAVVFWRFDPDRVRRLLSAFSEPGAFLHDGPQGPGRGAPPSGFLVYGAAATIAAVVAGFRRNRLAPGTFAVILGAALTVIALTGPWVQGDKTFRLQMNAAPLTWLCVLFAILQIGRDWVRATVGGLVLMLLLAPSALILKEGGRAIITPEAQAELRQIAPKIAHPERTLISARHGLEWWTAWTLGTHIAQAQALRPEDWERYEMVCILEEKRGAPGGFPGFLPDAGFGPPGMGPGPQEKGWLAQLLRLMIAMPGPPGTGRNPGGPPGMGPEPRPGMFGPPGEFQPWPHDGPGPFPTERVIRPGEIPQGPPPQLGRGPGPGFGFGRRGGMPMGMSGAPLPDDAEILHDGTHFRLGKAVTVPDFVREEQKRPRRE